MPLVVLGISYTLFGLDVVGDELEQPFGTDGGDLALDQLTSSSSATPVPGSAGPCPTPRSR